MFSYIMNIHEQLPSIESSHLREFAWIYCQDHVGVGVNERSHMLASRVIVSGTATMDHGGCIEE